MRQLTDHITNSANEALTISVLDGPGQGGACHAYEIAGFDAKDNEAAKGINLDYLTSTRKIRLSFQNGPINQFGVNGITQEALLAIVIDRLRSFQAGPFSCRENAIALIHCEDALLWLQKRTRDRLARGVEGTNQQ